MRLLRLTRTNSPSPARTRSGRASIGPEGTGLVAHRFVTGINVRGGRGLETPRRCLEEKTGESDDDPEDCAQSQGSKARVANLAEPRGEPDRREGDGDEDLRDIPQVVAHARREDPGTVQDDGPDEPRDEPGEDLHQSSGGENSP